MGSALYDQAAVLMVAGRLRDAIKPLKVCIAKGPGAALYYRALGIVFAKLDEGEKAKAYYDQYLKVAPNAQDAEDVRRLIARYQNQTHN